jgi:hypothetical protein
MDSHGDALSMLAALRVETCVDSTISATVTAPHDA